MDGVDRKREMGDGRQDGSSTYLMCSLVLTQVTTIRACKLAKPAFMRFLPLMQRADMRLQLRMRGRCISAAIAYIRAFASVCALVVIFCLVGSERLVAPGVAACVGAVACVAEQVAGELGTLFEVLRGSVATFPLAEAGCAVVDVGSFDVLVEGRRGGEDGKAEETGCVLPSADAVCFACWCAGVCLCVEDGTVVH